MKRFLAITALGIASALPAMAPAMASPQNHIGNWVNVNANTRSITHFVVSRRILPFPQAHQNVRVFGKCHPTDCDWGTATLSTSGNTSTATFNPGFAIKKLYFVWEGNRVQVRESTHFTDKSGRKDYFDSETFTYTP